MLTFLDKGQGKDEKERMGASMRTAVHGSAAPAVCQLLFF